MRLTLRGWAVLAIVAGSIAMGWEYGPRALNAIVAPLIVVLVAGVVTVARANRPRVRRSAVSDGSVGETRAVSTTIETDRAVAATVTDAVGDGLRADAPSQAVTLEGETDVRYGIELDARGEHRVGPLSIGVVDLFGLVERRFRYEETVPVVVYPPVHELRGATDRDLHLLSEAARRHDRGEFDHLREYQRGDSLRDVHWKSAAKRPDDDLVVTEYAHVEDGGSATVAAECIPGKSDELAAAVASVVGFLLETNVDVGLCLPEHSRPPRSGQDHRDDLLGMLAVTEAGELDDRERASADVLVQADVNGTRVVVDGREIPFDRLRGREGGGDRGDTPSSTDRGTGEPTGDGASGVTA